MGRPTLVVHARPASPPTRVGFVVPKAVGNAVTRNRVKRRLRHLAAGQLTSMTVPLQVVVRAMPAASAHSSRLADDFASAWAVSLKRLRDRAAASSRKDDA